MFDPGTAVPLGAPGSINMLPLSQKTSRAHYPNPLPPWGEGVKAAAARQIVDPSVVFLSHFRPRC